MENACPIEVAASRKEQPVAENGRGRGGSPTSAVVGNARCDGEV